MKRFICVAIVCSLPTYVVPCSGAEVSPKSEHAGDHETVLEQIHRDWEFRRSKISAFRLVVEGSRVVRKGMKYLGPNRLGLELSFPPNDYEFPCRTDVTIDVAKKRIRKLERYDVADHTNLVPLWVTAATLFCSDGQVWWKSYHPEEREFQGGTLRMGYDAKTGCRKETVVLSRTESLFFSYTFGASIGHALDAAPWILKARVREVEKTDNEWIARLGPEDGQTLPENEIVIDLAKQSAVTRWTVAYPSGPTTKVMREIQYDKTGDLWVPTSWVHTEYMHNKEAQQDRMKVIKFDPKPNLSDEMFRFSPTPGMKVKDLDKGEIYLVPANESNEAKPPATH